MGVRAGIVGERFKRLVNLPHESPNTRERAEFDVEKARIQSNKYSYIPER